MTNKNVRIPKDKSGKPVQMPRIRQAAAERQPMCSQDFFATRLDGGLDSTSQVTSKCKEWRSAICSFRNSQRADPTENPTHAHYV